MGRLCLYRHYLSFSLKFFLLVSFLWCSLESSAHLLVVHKQILVWDVVFFFVDFFTGNRALPCDQSSVQTYSQSRSRVNSNSKNEMNIRISLCNVPRVNEMLDISLEIVPKKTD